MIKQLKLAVAVALSAGLLLTAGSASAITVDGDLSDLISAVGSATYNMASGTDPIGSADSPVTESNNGFDIKDAYAWYNPSIDTLYLGLNYYGTVGDSLNDASTLTCEDTSLCFLPPGSFPNITRTIFDGNEIYQLRIYDGTDDTGTELLRYLLTGIESTGGESVTGANPFGLTVEHAVSESFNGVEYSVTGLLGTGALPALPADLYLEFWAGSIDFNPVSQGAEDTFALQMQAVPVPAAIWLFGSGLVAMAGLARRKSNKHTINIGTPIGLQSTSAG